MLFERPHHHFEGQCGCTDRLIGIGESQFKCILSIKPVFWLSLSAVQPWFSYTTVNIGYINQYIEYFSKIPIQTELKFKRESKIHLHV